MRDNRDILDKLCATVTDMEFYEAPGEWLVHVEQAKAEIKRLQTALNRLADEPFSDLESVRAFVCSVLRKGANG